MPIPAQHQPKTILKLGGALILLLPILLLAKIGFEIRENDVIGLDMAILQWLHSFASPALNAIATFFTSLGGPGFILLATIATAIILHLKHQTGAVTILLLGVIGATIINVVLKLSFARARPTLWEPVIVETSFSFPSGHAMASSALALSAMVILYHTRWRWAAIIGGAIYIFLIGLTRVYLGVHFPTDVVAGWIVSFIWIAVIYAVLSSAGRQAKPASPPAR